MSAFEIIDSHLHVYDLRVRSNFPNQNPTHAFPSVENEGAIVMDMSQDYAKEIANQSGVKKVVFVMCFDDCPEEAEWVYANAQKVDLIVGIVAGLDLTKHDKLKSYINKFKIEFKGPRFVGIRHHICYNDKLLWSPDFQKGLLILEEENVPFDLGINDTILSHVPFLAQKFPKLKMVIDHLAKPQFMNGQEALDKWKQDIVEIAKWPNVYMKLSGLVSDLRKAEPWSLELFQPYIDHCIKQFGAKRSLKN